MTPEKIASYLTKNASADEEKELYDWVAESEENKALFAQIKNAWVLSSLDAQYTSKATQNRKFNALLQEISENDEEFQLPKTSKLIRFSQEFWKIAAVMLVSVGLSFLFAHQLWYTPPKQITYHQLIVPGGQQAQLCLEDGTKIWLNSKSKLTYPSGFSGDFREVSIEGEAYFEVAHNESKPFIVKTSNLNVKVLGTCFNVTAYSDDKEMKFTLVKGSISLSSKNDTSELVRLKPNDMAIYSKEKSSLSTIQVEPEMYTAWRDGQFKFKKLSFEDISKRLSRNYNVEFQFQNQAIKKITFTGSFYNYESLEQVLNIMKASSHYDYQINKNRVTIK